MSKTVPVPIYALADGFCITCFLRAGSVSDGQVGNRRATGASPLILWILIIAVYGCFF